MQTGGSAATLVDGLSCPEVRWGICRITASVLEPEKVSCPDNSGGSHADSPRTTVQRFANTATSLPLKLVTDSPLWAARTRSRIRDFSFQCATSAVATGWYSAVSRRPHGSGDGLELGAYPRAPRPETVDEEANGPEAHRSPHRVADTPQPPFGWRASHRWVNRRSGISGVAHLVRPSSTSPTSQCEPLARSKCHHSAGVRSTTVPAVRAAGVGESLGAEAVCRRFTFSPINQTTNERARTVNGITRSGARSFPSAATCTADQCKAPNRGPSARHRVGLR